MLKICGKDVMPPSKKCHYILKNAEDRCKTKVLDALCKPVAWLRNALCPILKFGDAICRIPSKIKENLTTHLFEKFSLVFNKCKLML